MAKLFPFVAWAGGKTQLLDFILPRIPKNYSRYFEPFLGGGAVFLALQPKQATVSDSNPQLVNAYAQIKNNTESVIQYIQELSGTEMSKEYYLSLRLQFNEKIKQNILDSEAAALFIQVNRHCFNGLYRVNRKGFFNVAYNPSKANIKIDEKNIRAISEYLQASNIEVACLDFEQACSSVSAEDFVYFDSPYVPLSKTANFTSYTKEGFGLEDHRRLASLFRKLDKKGAKLMLSNNNTNLVRELYSGYKIEIVSVRRSINSVGTKRTSEEILITNY